jgi:single-strand DNA-binding protein
VANEPILTIIGNVGGDPELRFTNGGVAVCGFTVGVTPRVKKGDAWEDGEATWYRCTAWRQLGENVAESLQKGDRVVVQGKVSMRKFDRNDGGQGQSLELQVDAVGPDLRYRTVGVNRVQRGQGPSVPGEDPWAAIPPQAQSTGFADQPPF